MIADETVLNLSQQMKFQSLGDGQPTVIVSLDSGYLYTANQTTQSFLRAVDGRKTFGKIVEELAGQYDVPLDKLRADMSTLVEKMVSENLLMAVKESGSFHA